MCPIELLWYVQLGSFLRSRIRQQKPVEISDVLMSILQSHTFDFLCKNDAFPALGVEIQFAYSFQTSFPLEQERMLRHWMRKTNVALIYLMKCFGAFFLIKSLFYDDDMRAEGSRREARTVLLLLLLSDVSNSVK